LATAARAARASESVTPAAWANQVAGSENPRSLWAPHAGARAAATTRSAALRFSTLARVSTTAAQSTPDSNDGSNPDKASPNDSTAAVNSASTTHLLTYLSSNQWRGGSTSPTHEWQQRSDLLAPTISNIRSIVKEAT
jgi:hypothetical protein